MKIQLRFFAGLREALGTGSELIELPPQVRTVGEVHEHLLARGGVWAETLAQKKSLRMAYDQEITDPATQIAEGGEVAFFPPVTGG